MTDDQTASLWDAFDIAMALSKTSDPSELNGIANARLDLSSSTVKSPSSPSDLAQETEKPSAPAKYQASQQSDHATVEPIPLPSREDFAITSDEALAILTSPESLSLSPAPKNNFTQATNETASSGTEKQVD